MKQADQLRALTLGEPADRLAGRDPAVNEDLVDLDAPVLRDGQQHVEDLGRLDVLRRVEQQRVDRPAARLQVPLELSPLDADLVGSGEGVHPLVERALWSGGGVCGRRAGRRHHGRRVYTPAGLDQAKDVEFTWS